MSGPAGYENDFEQKMKEKGYGIKMGEMCEGHDPEVIQKFNNMKEGEIGVDDAKIQDLKIPPTPIPLRSYGPEETQLRYKGKESDFNARIVHKLLRVWILWAQLRTCLPLEECLARECRRDSDEYLAKSTIVDIMDVLAKVLTDTDTLQEFKHLMSS
jgi:hypothetical protein